MAEALSDTAALHAEAASLGPILVWGAGAIGGTLGAAWARAGHDVLFVDIDADHVAAMNRDGIEIEGPVEQFVQKVRAVTPNRTQGHVALHRARREGASYRAGRQGAAAASRRRRLRAVGAERPERARHRQGRRRKHRVLGCFVNYGADYMAPGRIMRGNHGAVVVGELDGSVTPRLKATYALLREFEPDAIMTTDIWSYLWGKLGYGALLFATALTNESIADALASERHRGIFLALGREVMAVAAARGEKPTGFNGFNPAAFAPGADPALLTASIKEMVAFNRGSAKSHSGIWRDLAVRKRRTEVDAQIGIIGETARGMGLQTPALDRLVGLIHDIEDGRKPLAWATLDEMLPVAAKA